MRHHATVALVVVAIALGACSSQTEAPQSTTSATTVAAATTLAATTSSAAEPEEDEGFALGLELDPGTYTSEVFATPVTFTVPAGWKVFEDEPGQFGLARMANDGPPLLVLRDISGAATDCREEPEPGVGNSSEALSTWLAIHEGLVTTSPVAAAVGGLDGYVVDTALDPAWTEACPFSNGHPTVMTVVGSDISRGLHWGVDETSADRIWVLDLPPATGSNIVIMADACCGVSKDEQWAAAQTVVESFEFDTSG